MEMRKLNHPVKRILIHIANRYVFVPDFDPVVLDRLDLRERNDVRFLAAHKITGQRFFKLLKRMAGQYFFDRRYNALVIAHAFDVQNVVQENFDQLVARFHENIVNRR